MRAVVLLVLVLASAAVSIAQEHHEGDDDDDERAGKRVVKFVVATTTFGSLSKTYTVSCGGGLWYSVTGDTRHMRDADAVIFHGPDVVYLPLAMMEERDPAQVWVLRSMESSENDRRVDRTVPNARLALFNLTSTYRRDSDGWIPYMPQSVRAVMAPVVPTAQRTKSAPVVWVASNCWTVSGRTEFVQELAKHVRVDAFGRCGEPTDETPLKRGGNGTAFREFLSRYKFYIALENSECQDYLTEKYWRSLQLGLIPIVWGTAEGVDDFAPTNRSVVKVSSFKTIRDLAEFIKQVDANDALFEQFMTYKDVMLPGGDGRVQHRSPASVLSAKFLSLYKIPRGECALARRVITAVDKYRITGIPTSVTPDQSCLHEPSWTP
jgi:hypothetical protein